MSENEDAVDLNLKQYIGTPTPHATSFNNRLVLETYKSDRGLRANVSSGFAQVEQKVAVKGLKVLMNARIQTGNSEPLIVLAGSIAYVREEYLHTQPWAQKILKSDAVQGDFIIVDLNHVEFILS